MPALMGFRRIGSGWKVFTPTRQREGEEIDVPLKNGKARRVTLTKYWRKHKGGHLYWFAEVGSKGAVSATRRVRVERITKKSKADRRRAAKAIARKETAKAITPPKRTCTSGMSQDAAEAMERRNKGGTVAYECAYGDHWHVRQP